MCDTFYMRRADGTTRFFAKNSDRDPNEPQYMLLVRAGSVSTPKTYVAMPSHEVKHDVWLSKPSWMWGAEMGVNSQGVCIGNEATFNRVPVDKTGVLGMDHLRTALELASTAREALDILIQNTRRFGQGGNGGYENPLYYHNSYLIMDPYEGYVLETVGRYYAYKKLDANYNISNKVSLTDDFHELSPELQGKVTNFERHFINPIVSYFAGAYHREARGRELMAQSHFNLEGAIDVLGPAYRLRRIDEEHRDDSRGAGEFPGYGFHDLRLRYRTYMVHRRPLSGGPLFKPLKFDYRSDALSSNLGSCAMSDETQGLKRWKYNNLLFRAVLKDYDNNVERLRPVLREYQDRLFELAESLDGAELSHKAQAINTEYVHHALKLVGEGPLKGGWQFRRYWRKQNQALFCKEDDDELRELYQQYLY